MRGVRFHQQLFLCYICGEFVAAFATPGTGVRKCA